MSESHDKRGYGEGVTSSDSSEAGRGGGVVV